MEMNATDQSSRQAEALSSTKGALTYVAQYQLVIWLVLALVRGIVFTLVVPPWQHPDEPTHFEHVRMVAQFDRLPDPWEVDLGIRKEIAESMLRNKFWRDSIQPALDDQSLAKPYNSPLGIYTLSQPKLYYLVASIWLKPWLEQPVDTQLHAVRLLSVLCAMLVVLLAYLSSRWLLPRRHALTAAVCASIVFLPSFTDIMSAANNDSLVNVLCALFITAFAWLVSHRVNLLTGMAILLLMGLSLAAAMATKATAISLVIAAPIGLLAVIIVRLLFMISAKQGNKKALISVLAAGIVIATLGITAAITLVAARNTELVQQLGSYLRLDVAGTLNNLLNPQVPYEMVAGVVFQSFFAVFGWRHVYVAPWMYMIALAISVLAVSGVFVWLSWLRRQAAETRRRLLQYAVFAIVTVVVAWIIAILRSQADQSQSLYHSHGRYVYIALAQSAIIAVVGLLGWLPSLWHKRGAIAIVAIVVAFDAVCFWGYLVPHYYVIPFLGVT